MRYSNDGAFMARIRLHFTLKYLTPIWHAFDILRVTELPTIDYGLSQDLRKTREDKGINGGADQDRTGDLLTASQALSRTELQPHLKRSKSYLDSRLYIFLGAWSD